MQIQTTLWTTTDEEQHGYGGGTDRDTRHGVAKPVAAKQAGSVRADLNARPNLALRDGLLKQRNLETGPAQRNGGGHASNAGADHQSMKTFHRATSRMRGISEDSFEDDQRACPVPKDQCRHARVAAGADPVARANTRSATCRERLVQQPKVPRRSELDEVNGGKRAERR